MTKTLKLAFAFVGLNILDIILTKMAYAKGALIEVIPMMKNLIEISSGIAWTIKISVIILTTTLLLLFANRYPKQVNKIFIALIIVTVICVINLQAVIKLC